MLTIYGLFRRFINRILNHEDSIEQLELIIIYMKTHLRINILTTVIFLFISQLSLSQMLNSDFNNKLRYTRALSIARSTFDVTGFPSSPNYASLELRLGAGIVKPLGKYFDLKSGVYLGLKMKRQSYYFGPSKQYTYEPWVHHGLDQTASSRNHIVLDIPFTLQFKPPKTKLGLRAGLNARFWAPNNANVDVLTARPELGLLGGVSHKLVKAINIGFDYYHGLTDIHSGSMSQSGEFHVRNQFIQLTLEHYF